MKISVCEINHSAIIVQTRNRSRYFLSKSFKAVLLGDRLGRISIRGDLIKTKFVNGLWPLDPIMTPSYFKRAMKPCMVQDSPWWGPDTGGDGWMRRMAEIKGCDDSHQNDNWRFQSLAAPLQKNLHYPSFVPSGRIFCLKHTIQFWSQSDGTKCLYFVSYFSLCLFLNLTGAGEEN